jgi:hypothetical protein
MYGRGQAGQFMGPGRLVGRNSPHLCLLMSGRRSGDEGSSPGGLGFQGERLWIVTVLGRSAAPSVAS